MTKNRRQQRQMLFNKFHGKCAYCGSNLGEKWHADHLNPIIRNTDGTCDKPLNEVEENYMPACISCNLSKKRMGLEDWRKWIQGHIISLNRDSPAYKTLKRYHLITEKKKLDVVFYFETLIADSKKMSKLSPSGFGLIHQDIVDWCDRAIRKIKKNILQCYELHGALWTYRHEGFLVLSLDIWNGEELISSITMTEAKEYDFNLDDEIDLLDLAEAVHVSGVITRALGITNIKIGKDL